jgi:hypothetical protein
MHKDPSPIRDPPFTAIPSEAYSSDSLASTFWASGGVLEFGEAQPAKSSENPANVLEHRHLFVPYEKLQLFKSTT